MGVEEAWLYLRQHLIHTVSQIYGEGTYTIATVHESVLGLNRFKSPAQVLELGFQHVQLSRPMLLIVILPVSFLIPVHVSTRPIL